MNHEFMIRVATVADKEWVRDLLEREWGSSEIVTRDRVHAVDALEGLIAHTREGRLGLIMYTIQDRQCEIVSLNSLQRRVGIASALLNAVRTVAQQAGCRRLWLVTTNDNTLALHFYQQRGCHLAALYPNALEASRRLKPEIPRFGVDGIPLRDEIELEFLLR